MAQKIETAIKNLGTEIKDAIDNHVVLKAHLHEKQQCVASLHPEDTYTAAASTSRVDV